MYNFPIDMKRTYIDTNRLTLTNTVLLVSERIIVNKQTIYANVNMTIWHFNKIGGKTKHFIILIHILLYPTAYIETIIANTIFYENLRIL